MTYTFTFTFPVFMPLTGNRCPPSPSYFGFTASSTDILRTLP